MLESYQKKRCREADDSGQTRVTSNIRLINLVLPSCRLGSVFGMKLGGTSSFKTQKLGNQGVEEHT
jgi:hypothetical protein